jgi:hypothetical protein
LTFGRNENPVNISDIHFHDSQILRVTEDPSNDTLTMEVMYPVDWQNNRFEHRRLIFTDAYSYQAFEGPFLGCPTILDAKITTTVDRWSKIRLETTAGFREVMCVAVSLVSMNQEAEQDAT